MAWKKINSAVQMWEKPALGTLDQKDGRRYMALCIDPSSKNPYRGIARQVVDREGDVNVSGYVDISKLILVESDDLLNWRETGDLEIKGLEKILERLVDGDIKSKVFVGLEDPDIILGEEGIKHVYFTIPFVYERNGKKTNDVYVGHAFGKSLNHLTATDPVLRGINKKIRGFKEICPVPSEGSKRFVMSETSFYKGRSKIYGEKDTEYSAIGLSQADDLAGEWKFLKLIHDPEEDPKEWCAGSSSPCRIFDPDTLNHNGFLVGIMNGRELPEIIDGKIFYKKFRPGLFLFDPKKREMNWISDEPLLEDPLATTITFASELILLNEKEALLYAHVNDSFVRVYKLNLNEVRKMLPKNI